MALNRDVLVLTTPTVEGLVIKRYLKPVSAHLVAGTNLINDFFGSISDVLGGRSETYKQQLSSLYNDAIEAVKIAAFEMGANCVLNLHIDLDEISGKGKSMFMVTAVGTAVVIESSNFDPKVGSDRPEKLDMIRLDVLKAKKEKKIIIAKALDSSLVLDDRIWQFLTENQVHEVFPALVKTIPNAILQNISHPHFFERFIAYVDALPDEIKLEKLYGHIGIEEHEVAIKKLIEVIQILNLFDYKHCMELLQSNDLPVVKRGLALATCDKIYYNATDIIDLEKIKSFLQVSFGERGVRSKKKLLLSSKEKDVWTCECGKTNDIDTFCSGCEQDIFGFKYSDVKPQTVQLELQQKIELLKEAIL